MCPLDKIQPEQAKNKQLQPLLLALENQQPLPASLAPGLKQVFLLNGVICHHFGNSSASSITEISLDIMGLLPVINGGNKYILVATDLFTK